MILAAPLLKYPPRGDEYQQSSLVLFLALSPSLQIWRIYFDLVEQRLGAQGERGMAR